ncbi:MAG: hypothetical protein RL318_1387 [Fibrobacterota bacterium]
MSGEPQWLLELRAKARGKAHELGLPSRKLEEWKYTSSARFLLEEDTSAIGPVDCSTFTTADSTYPLEAEAPFLELVDGHPVRDFLDLPDGVFFGSFASALARPDLAALLEAKLASVIDWNGQALPAWNLSSFQTGVLLHVPAGVSLEIPLQLFHRQYSSASPAWNWVLVVLGENARASLAEVHESSEGMAHRSLIVTEVVLGANAQLTHGRIGLQGRGDTVWASTAVKQARSSNYQGHLAQIGAEYARIETVLNLAETDCEGSLKGVFRPDADRHIDIQTVVDHAAPKCRSAQTVKGVLDGESTGVFHGRVYVRPGAAGTRAQQSNRNLLLSRKATVHARPQLEIENDDVKASHGSATGNLDEKALFFLRARGFSHAAARAVLIRAFLQEVADQMPWPELKGRVQHLLEGQA